MINKSKLIRIATVAISLGILLKGQLRFLQGYFEVKALSGLDENNIGFTFKKNKDLYFKINYILNNPEELDFI